MNNSENIAIKKIIVERYDTKSKSKSYDFVINPYVGCSGKCAYCYARYMKKFTGHAEEWGDFLDIKYAEKGLSQLRLTNKKVHLSSVTDPYNKYEEEYKITQKILSDLVTINPKLRIETKSDLILRDLDVLKKIKNLVVSFSFFTTDENARANFELGTTSIDKRINAIKILKDNGIKINISISPIMPGLTDYKEIISKTIEYADSYDFENLKLHPEYRKHIMPIIEKHYPELLPLYIDIYKNGKISYWQPIEEEIETYCTENNLNFSIDFHY